MVGYGVYLNSDWATKGWIDFGDRSDKCLGNLALCTSGMTLTLWLKVLPFEGTSTSYLLSTGGESNLSHGIAILTQSGKVRCLLRTRIGVWDLQIGSADFQAGRPHVIHGSSVTVRVDL